ncbi:hypothetical protein FVEN_g6717 [Fusarium venenatum]|uniref:CBM-cenC domain-containing protein n=1 Tax=Fusarium venenatum TaxID=56646 RepID=A0A2L2TKF1_9HYPO|nr:uncharacterized protein FVRRES_00098 [Fusarium venenatum]KAG8355449.1 hypothetical protein FVEN_g6717 [Fusarium venenatum]KAH7006644.1 hypothetical protein EDB82DRAFT_522577 [Fusarium venenatum]CEI63586.1 unnamed protein product [Fusarium venenatum]
MKATRVSLTLAALVFYDNVYASPCKPKSSTTAILTSSEVLTTTGTISVSESSVAGLPSSISELASTIATATSSVAESASTITTVITSVAEPSSTAILTSSDAPTTTTAVEESSPSGLFINPSFDESNASGDYDGSPWILEDAVSPLSVSINSDLGHSGSHSAYWSITNTAQAGSIHQRLDLERDGFYTLSYWWYVDEIEQPSGLSTCYIQMKQQGVDGRTSAFPDFFILPETLPLSTWTKREIIFNPTSITPAFMKLSVACYGGAGSGVKIAIDDVSLVRRV